ncbi:MAG: hypothetical protein M3Q08_00355 [Pseudomonadota bacterium]|nr:hypothetical protein [Pseudomonadota bacterium]
MQWTKRRFHLVLLATASLLLALLVVRTTGLAAVLEHDFARAAALAPQDTRVELASASLLFHLGEGQPTPNSLSFALRAARDAPLALEPALISGAAAAAAGQAPRAEALLLEARRRDPRSPLVRAQLLQHYATAGRVAEAATELAVLARLVPAAAGELFIPQLAFYADDVANRDAYARVLAAHPQVRQALLQHLIAIGEDPDLVIELAARSGQSTPREKDEAWQMPLVQRLVDRGEVQRAYRLWLRFTGSGAGSGKLLHDGSFRAPPRPGPFGWQLSDQGGGVAERGNRPGLAVSYYGREPAELARQLIILPPGRYRLASKLSGNVPAGRSALSWRLSCLDGGGELLNHPLGEVTSRTSQLAADFIVPSGCTGQWLVLAGNPPEFSKTENIWVHEVQIRRVS